MLIRAATLMADIGRVSPDRQSTPLMTDMFCFKTAILKTPIFQTAILKTAAIKTVAVMAILMGCSAANASAQKIYSVKYQNQADVKVYVVKYENQADLKVYKVQYESQAGRNDGKWHFVKYEN